MRGFVSTAVTIAAVAMLTVSVAGAQVPDPTARPLVRAGERDSSRLRASDGCRSASRIATLREHERIAILCPDSLELGPVHDLTDLLSSRIPGVLVQESSGTVGTAARIRIRGVGSIELDNEPIVIVDGVRVLSTPVKTEILDPQLPSRLDDIRVEDIETVEVLRGPATTALYGTGAAGGVIRITTKQGKVGRPRWNAFAEAGPVREVTRYPKNYAQSGTLTATGTPTFNCTLAGRAQGTCTPDDTPLASYSPLNQASPFRDGLRGDYGASVTGGADWLRYYGGAGYSSEEGVFENSSLIRRHVRLNLDLMPIADLRIGVRTAYLSGDAQFPKGEDGVRSVLFSGLMGYADPTRGRNGYLYGEPDSAFRVRSGQDTERIQAGFSADWAPLRWIALSAGAGMDRTTTDELERLPDRDEASGEIRKHGSMRGDNATAGLSAIASFGMTRGISASTRIGIDHDRMRLRRGWRADYDNGLFDSFFREDEWATTGLYLDQRLAWRGRLHAHAGLRRDRFSNDDDDAPHPVARSAGISWLARRAPSGEARALFGSLRAHVAYGSVSGLRFPFDFGSGDFPIILVNSSMPDAEETSEIEFGITGSFFGERLDISLSHYDKTTTDGFVLVPVGFGGGFHRAENQAEVNNTGFEATVDADIVDNSVIALGASLGGWTNTNEVVSLGDYTYQRALQPPTVSRPLGGFFGGFVRAYQDLDGDGLVTESCQQPTPDPGGPQCEIEMDGEGGYRGSSTPKLEVFLAPRLTLYGRVTISALLDYRGGFKQYNRTEVVRCFQAVCRGLVDPDAPLGEQARAIAVRQQSDGNFVEDADFVKLREMSVSLSVPEAWAQRLGGSAARLTFSGRNLATWTDYSGLDPEINGTGPLGFAQGEFFTQPPVRHYSARLAIDW